MKTVLIMEICIHSRKAIP